MSSYYKSFLYKNYKKMIACVSVSIELIVPVQPPVTWNRSERAADRSRQINIKVRKSFRNRATESPRGAQNNMRG